MYLLASSFFETLYFNLLYCFFVLWLTLFLCLLLLLKQELFLLYFLLWLTFLFGVLFEKSIVAFAWPISPLKGNGETWFPLWGNNDDWGVNDSSCSSLWSVPWGSCMWEATPGDENSLWCSLECLICSGELLLDLVLFWEGFSFLRMKWKPKRRKVWLLVPHTYIAVVHFPTLCNMKKFKYFVYPRRVG